MSQVRSSEPGGNRLVIVMPAYNEEECIAGVCREWIDLCRRYPGTQLLVVNDGSKDRTGAILEELRQEASEWLTVLHKSNGGHGSALIAGYQAAHESGAKWVFQTDSDGQIAAAEFEKVWAIRDAQALALGVRATRNDPFGRLVITRILRALIFLVFFRYVRDANTPFRLFPRSILEEFLGRVGGPLFAPNIYLSVLAKARFQIRETSVAHQERLGGKGSLLRLSLLSACLRCTRELLENRTRFSRR